MEYVSVPNSTRVDCDGSIAGKSTVVRLVAPYEQLAEVLTVAEHTSISIGLEYVKL